MGPVFRLSLPYVLYIHMVARERVLPDPSKIGVSDR